MSAIDKFLDRPSTRAALKIPPWVLFEQCSDTVDTSMYADDVFDAAPIIPTLLANNITTLVYVGVQDLICNWLGEPLPSPLLRIPAKSRIHLTPLPLSHLPLAKRLWRWWEQQV